MICNPRSNSNALQNGGYACINDLIALVYRYSQWMRVIKYIMEESKSDRA